MGDAKTDDLRVGFNSHLALNFCGSKVTSDAERFAVDPAMRHVVGGWVAEADYGYAIRIKSNTVLKLEIAHLLIRPVGRPSHKPKVFYHSFRCQSKWGIPVLSSAADVDNLLIEMTCKQLSQNLHVYALSLNGDLAGRMTKLGVDEVICPYLFC